MQSRVGAARGGAAVGAAPRGCGHRAPRAGPERVWSVPGRGWGVLGVTARGRAPKPCSSHGGNIPGKGGKENHPGPPRRFGRAGAAALIGAGENPGWFGNESWLCFGRLWEARCRCVARANRDVNSRGRVFIITEKFSGRGGCCWAKETLRRKRQAAEAALPTARGDVQGVVCSARRMKDFQDALPS